MFEGYLDYENLFDSSIDLLKYGRYYKHGHFCKVGFIWPRFNQPLLNGKGIIYDLEDIKTIPDEKFGFWSIQDPSFDSPEYDEVFHSEHNCRELTDFITNRPYDEH